MVRSETRRSWDKSPDWGRPGTVFKTSQKRKGLPWEWRRKGRRLLLRGDHFDTPGGVGLRNLTRTGYRQLLGIDNGNEHRYNIVILFCSYDICRR